MDRCYDYPGATLSVLAASCAEPSDCGRGHEMAKYTGLKAGTLYPILIRLADRGLVEARWDDGQPAGRPRRHLYRLSCAGQAQAREALAASVPLPRGPRLSPGPGGRRAGAGSSPRGRSGRVE